MCDEVDLEAAVAEDRRRRGLRPLTDGERVAPAEPKAARERREARDGKPVQGWFFQWCEQCQAKRIVAPDDQKPFVCWCCGG